MDLSLKKLISESLSEVDLVATHITQYLLEDVKIDKDKKYLIIKFKAPFKENPFHLITKFKDFKKWYNNNKDKKEMFNTYLNEFLNETKNLNEIIDDGGNIMKDDDIPTNSTNTMVGSNLTGDQEKWAARTIPMSSRNVTTNIGVGAVTW